MACRHSRPTVGVERLPEVMPLRTIKLDLGVRDSAVLVTRAAVHAFVNAVHVAARELFRTEPGISMGTEE